jgi:hypothetical protein
VPLRQRNELRAARLNHPDSVTVDTIANVSDYVRLSIEYGHDSTLRV